MKRLFIYIALWVTSLTFAQNVKVNQLTFKNQYTIAERDALSLGASDRKMIYVIDTGVNETQIWDGDSWETLGSGGGTDILPLNNTFTGANTFQQALAVGSGTSGTIRLLGNNNSFIIGENSKLAITNTALVELGAPDITLDGRVGIGTGSTAFIDFLDGLGTTGITVDVGEMQIRSDNVLNLTSDYAEINSPVVRINGSYNLPSTDGTNGQVMTTDGSGNVTFQDASGGGSSTDDLDDVAQRGNSTTEKLFGQSLGFQMALGGNYYLWESSVNEAALKKNQTNKTFAFELPDSGAFSIRGYMPDNSGAYTDLEFEEGTEMHNILVRNQSGTMALLDDITDNQTAAEVTVDDATFDVISGTNLQSTAISTDNALFDLENTKQDNLSSGVNIKTINGNSVLGSGDLVVTGSGTIDTDDFVQKIVSPNLFNVSTMVEDEFVRNTGVVTSSGTYNRSDFIDVIPTESYVCNVDIRFTSYYDAAESHLSGGSSTTITAGTVITIPANVYKVIITVFSSDDENTIQFENNTVSTPYQAFGITYIDKDLIINSGALDSLTTDVSNLEVSVTNILSSLDKDYLLNEFHTEGTTLSIPFFDTRYVSNDTLINAVNPLDIFVAASGREGTVQEDGVLFASDTKYVNSNKVYTGKGQNYLVFAVDSISTAGDKYLMGTDDGSSYFLLRTVAGTLNLTAANSEGWGVYTLPAWFDETQPFIIQLITGYEVDDVRCFINGEQLVRSGSNRTVYGQPTFDFIGEDDLNTSRNIDGKLIYYKAKRGLADRKEVNKDLALLSNLMGITDYKPVNNIELKNINVLIRQGQSNASSRAQSNDSITTSHNYRKGYYWDSDKSKITPFGAQGSNISVPTFADWSMAHAFIDVISHRQIIAPVIDVVHGPGGTAFYQNEWNPGDPEYEILVDKVNDLKYYLASQGYKATFVMYSALGEQDGRDATGTANYQTNWTNFYNQFKIDIGEPNLKVLMRVLGDEQFPSVDNVGDIQTAQRAIATADANIEAIETTGLGLRDASHDSFKAVETIGRNGAYICVNNFWLAEFNEN